MTLEISCSFIKIWEQPSFTKTRPLSQPAENLALWNTPFPCPLTGPGLGSHQPNYFDPFLSCRLTRVIPTRQSKGLINGSIWTRTCYLTSILPQYQLRNFCNFLSLVLFLTNPVRSLGRTVCGLWDWHFLKQLYHSIPLWLPSFLVYVL